jgi:hypothetical protein
MIPLDSPHLGSCPHPNSSWSVFRDKGVGGDRSRVPDQAGVKGTP